RPARLALPVSDDAAVVERGQDLDHREARRHVPALLAHHHVPDLETQPLRAVGQSCDVAHYAASISKSFLLRGTSRMRTTWSTTFCPNFVRTMSRYGWCR